MQRNLRTPQADTVDEQAGLHYKLLFNSLQEGFAVHDILCDETGCPVDYRFREVNAAFEKFSGFSREQLIGRTICEIAPGNHDKWIRRYGEVALSGQSRRFIAHARSLGRYFSIHAYSPHRGSFATLILDVTERMLQEESLREAKDKLEQKVSERTAQLDYANEALLARNADMVAMNEDLQRQNEQILTMSEIIADLNNQLQALNVDLERRIGDRTAALHAAYMEVAGQVSELAEAEGKLRRNAEIQSILREIAEAAVAVASLDVFFADIHRLLQRILPAKNFYISLHDRAGNRIHRPYCAEQADLVPLERPVGKGLTEYFMRMGKTVHISPDMLTALLASGEIAILFAPAVECIGSPLKDSRGIIFGVITVYLTRGMMSFLPQDSEVMSIVAAQVSLAIERKFAVETLAESEARYRAVIDQSPEAVLVIDPGTGEILEANSRFGEQFGYDLRRDGKLSLYDLALAKPDEVAAMLERLVKLTRLPLQRRIFNHRNGCVIAVERSARMIAYRGKRLAVMTIRDVSEELRREEEIKRDARMATRVQHALLAVPSKSEHLEIVTVYRPLLYVGGDLFFMDWRYGGVLLRGFLVDAAGHGLGTALHTASIHVLLRELNERDLPLTVGMHWLNNRLIEYFDAGTFAGALGFEIDLETKKFSWVCAGIPNFWLDAKERRGMVACAGMSLGVQEGENFELHSLPIHVGDAYYFMTDGLADLYDRHTVQSQHSFPAMVELLEALAQSPERRDDATAICIRIRSLAGHAGDSSGWPRILHISGYGDYQRLQGEVGRILAEVTGKPHSFQEVAVNEALANAMECRDGVPRQHKASLRFNKIGSRLIVRVKTSRIGFAGNAILRRLRSSPEEIFFFGEDVPMGRGIPMMLALSHKMMYNSEGTEVLLAWKL